MHDLDTFIHAVLSAYRSKSASSSDRLKRVLDNNELSWQQILAYSGDHLITPSVYLSLSENRQLEQLDPAVRDALYELYTGNQQRNATALRAFQHFVSVLNSIDVFPVPLKGIALIEQGYYPDSAERIISDIDVLIRKTDLQAVLTALSDNEYLQISNFSDPVSLTQAYEYLPLDGRDFRNQPGYIVHHLPAVQHTKYGINIEIHLEVCPEIDAMSVALGHLVYENAQIYTSGSITYRAATREFHVLHNFYHSQIMHGLGDTGRVDYRHLIDVRQLLTWEANTSSRKNTTDTVACLVGQSLDKARQYGVDREFVSYISQLVKVGSEPPELITTLENQFSSSSSTGMSGVDNPNRVRLQNLAWWLVPRLQGVMSRERFKLRYGPVPFHRALYKYLRYQVFRLARMVMK